VLIAAAVRKTRRRFSEFFAVRVEIALNANQAGQSYQD
jgi:hypothetical protein